MQTSIPMPQDIPAFDFKMFKVLNSCNDSTLKYSFYYNLKGEILDKYASTDFYDLQIIDRKCNNCNGSRKHWNGEPCLRCNATGIFRTDKVFLKRYVLNGELFHIPEDNEILMGVDSILVVNTIQGLIKHDHAKNNYSPVLAYAWLLLHYKPEMFHAFLKSIVKELRTNAQKKFKQLMHQHGALKAIYLFFNVPVKEELPF